MNATENRRRTFWEVGGILIMLAGLVFVGWLVPFGGASKTLGACAWSERRPNEYAPGSRRRAACLTRCRATFCAAAARGKLKQAGIMNILNPLLATPLLPDFPRFELFLNVFVRAPRAQPRRRVTRKRG